MPELDALDVLRSLRSRFEAGADRHPALRHLLIAGDPRPMTVNGPTPLVDVRALPRRWKRPKTVDSLAVRDRGIHPVCAGAWVLPEQGPPMHGFYFGEPPDTSGHALFRELAVAAGRCAIAIKRQRVGKSDPITMSHDPEKFWVMCLHELGMVKRHPGVRATLTVRAGGAVDIPRGRLEALRQADPKSNLFAFAAHKVVPGAPEFSILRPGVFLASAFAIDVLAPRLATDRTKESRPLGAGAPTVKKTPKLSAEVFRLLENPPPEGWTKKSLAKRAGYRSHSSLYKISGFSGAWQKYQRAEITIRARLTPRSQRDARSNRDS